MNASPFIPLGCSSVCHTLPVSRHSLTHLRPASYLSNQETRMSDTDMEDFKVIVVGGGLVGSLAGIYMAKRGFRVDVFEKRRDIRTEELPEGRSINLALSERGLAAMRRVGVLDGIMEHVVPMKGRMIHGMDGSQTSQSYSIHGECINSVGRKVLNEHLMNKAAEYPNLQFHFQHDLMQIDWDKGTVLFKDSTGDESLQSADLIIGADGAYSRTRTQLQRRIRMDFSQEYIPHGYVELTIPPSSSDSNRFGGWQMDPNHLHIWPKHTYMMIALPNPDKTFTCTLFMPFDKFDAIETKQDLIGFFQQEFPDSIPYIGRDNLTTEYFANPKGSLMMVKCKPYHFKYRGVIIGDAAHAMVPFYGQGMNCGMQDVVILDDMLQKHLPSNQGKPTPEAVCAALQDYSETRYPDAKAILDLAMHNYVEMRHGVTDWRYLLRKRVEGILHNWLPNTVIPLYTMVSFTQIPYSQVIERYKWQGKLLERSAVLALLLSILGMYRLFKKIRS